MGPYVPELASVAPELSQAAAGTDAVVMMQSLVTFGEALGVYADAIETAISTGPAEKSMAEALADQAALAQEGAGMIREAGSQISGAASNAVPKWESAQAEYEKAKLAAEAEAKEKEAAGGGEGGGQPAAPGGGGEVSFG